MSKKVLIFNSIAQPVLWAVAILYMIFSGLWLKGVTSAIFVIIALVNLYLVKKEGETIGGRFKVLLSIGLFVCFLADILLNIWFIVGALIFAIGHVFYFVAYTELNKVTLRDLYCALAIAIPSVIVLVVYPFDYQGIFVVVLFYALIISCMVGKSISLMLSKSGTLISRLIIMIGSILFFVSDLALLFNVFGNVGVVADNICLLTYYPAQGLLALAVYLASRKGDSKTKPVEEEKQVAENNA